MARAGSLPCQSHLKEMVQQLAAPHLELLSRFQTVTRRRFCSCSSCTWL